jgi:hypothetical protein
MMTTDQNQHEKLYNSRTKKDKNGHYPVWMNQRAIKRLKSKQKPSKK